MAYEIDFLPVGEGEKGGDAIALRYGSLSNPKEQRVLVLDGGTKDSGAALVEHIKTYYNTSTVNAVLCTHSDSDHTSGLTEVLENLSVHHLYMHLPWNHVQDLEGELKKASASDTVRQHFKKSLDSARELEKLANRKEIPITEPFSDKLPPNDTFAVLGPSTIFYESLLENFRCVDELALKEKPLVEKVLAGAERAIKWVVETWFSESLVEPDDASSAENNSSVILLFTDGNSRFLFTSDAAVPALTEAAEYAESIGIDLKTVEGLQVPHHGSKRNVGPTILNRIVGPKLKDQAMTKVAIASVPKDGAPKHPSKRVVNAFMRRGANVYVTAGNTLWQQSIDAPNRGWGNAIALPFYNRVED